MVSVFPGVLSIACAVLLIFYRLDASTCLQMQDVVFRGYYATFDLNTRRGSARGENDG